MLSIFHLLQFAGLIAGITFGTLFGLRHFGSMGAVVGAVLGLVVGFIVGRMPWELCWAWVWCDLKRATVAELREWLERRYRLSHLIIAELIDRGEPVGDFRDVVARQLRSDSADVRRFGEANARVWFPELVETE